MKKKCRFKRSIVSHAAHYRDMSIKEKLKETVRLSDFCIKFGEMAKKHFHGR